MATTAVSCQMVASLPSLPTVSSTIKRHNFLSACSFRLNSRVLPCLRNQALFNRLSTYRAPEKWGSAVACLPSNDSSTESEQIDPTKLYVSGLSFRTTEEGLRNAFQNYGRLVEANLVMDRIANRSRGFAFLRYSTEEESKKAIEELHGTFLDGRVIFVEICKPRSKLPQRTKRSPVRY